MKRPINETIELGHADQTNRRTVGVDRAGVDEVLQTAFVDEEQAIPLAHGVRGRVVNGAIFSGHAVKRLHAFRASRQFGPEKIGRKIGVEMHERRGLRPYEVVTRASIGVDLGK